MCFKERGIAVIFTKKRNQNLEVTAVRCVFFFFIFPKLNSLAFIYCILYRISVTIKGKTDCEYICLFVYYVFTDDS